MDWIFIGDDAIRRYSIIAIEIEDRRFTMITHNGYRRSIELGSNNEAIKLRDEIINHHDS